MFKESKYVKDKNYRVQTPYGWQRIEYIHKTKPLTCIKIQHLHGEITVAEHHTFVVDDQEIQAESIKPGSLLQTPEGYTTVLSTEPAGVQELYDISLDEEHFDNQVYFSDGVLSHNSGKSITVASYLCWLFVFFKDRNIGIVANRHAQAKKFLKDVKEIFTNLPMWMQPGVTEWNKISISNELGMNVLTDVPSADSFRGFSIHCVVVDECIHKNETITVRHKSGKIETLTIDKFYEKI